MENVTSISLILVTFRLRQEMWQQSSWRVDTLQQTGVMYIFNQIRVRLCGSTVINIKDKEQWQVDTAMRTASVGVMQVREAIVE